MAKDFFIDKLVVVGVGLMGGSLSLILKEKGAVGEVVGIGRGLKNLQTAKELGIVDSYTQSLEEGVKEADLILVATPVGSIAEIIKNNQQYMKDGAVITDVGSVKGDIVHDVDGFLDKRLSFVGSHPVAGTEKSGATAALSSLYNGSRCIVTPTEKTHTAALEDVKTMWQLAGAEVVVMTAEDHDKILAAISHLPHLVAYALVNSVDGIDDFNENILKYSAGGFRDFTRIASSNPEMWRDICLMNKKAMIDMTERYLGELSQLKEMLAAGDSDGLLQSFQRSKQARDAL